MARMDGDERTSGRRNSEGLSDKDQRSDSQRPNIKGYLNSKSFYICKYCRTHLADHDDLASTIFHGSHGRANLFNTVINVNYGDQVQRDLLTGSHIVSDIFCKKCVRHLGWHYHKAYARSQKYKEGKSVIELAHVIRENRHLDMDNSDIFFGSANRHSASDSSPGSSYRSSSYSSSSSSSENVIMRGSCSGLSEDPNGPQSILSCSYKSDSSDTVGYQPTVRDRLNSSTSSTKPIQIRKGSLASEQGARKGCMSESVANSPFDEDLLFAFYDDWHASKPGHSNNLSSTHFNRIRRSLYSESTRYDWKSASQEPDK